MNNTRNLLLLLLLIIGSIISCQPGDDNPNPDPNPTPVVSGLKDGRLIYHGGVGYYNYSSYVLNINTTDGSVLSNEEYDLKRAIVQVRKTETYYHLYNLADNMLGGNQSIKDSLFTYSRTNGTKSLLKAFPYGNGAGAVLGNLLVKDSAGTIIAYNLSDFSVKWRYKIRSGSSAAFVTLTGDESSAYYMVYDSIFSLSLSTGSLNWKIKFSGLFPVITDQHILLFSLGYNLNAINKSTGAIAWSKALSSSNSFLPVYAADGKTLVYTSDNKYTLVNLSTGADIWKISRADKLISFAISGDNIYALTDSARINVFRLSDGQLLKQSDQLQTQSLNYNGTALQNAMIVADTAIILNTNLKVMAIGKSSFTPIWSVNKNHTNLEFGSVATIMQLVLRDSVYLSNGVKYKL